MTQVGCRCGAVALAVEGPPIAAVECHCASCRRAGAMLEALPDALPVLDARGGTAFVMQRKDRVRFERGTEHLRALRLAEGGTRRVVATCCGTPVFLEFPGGHWLSLYAAIWTESARPRTEFRTMTGDRDLPHDVPNLRTHSLGFYARLLVAWARMGFRNPPAPDAAPLDLPPAPPRP
ncbi:GFA family protein [Jannaschia sp. W003]|uniref:GFA family protein n=1 Tax=Jannaschia sp. W003 TaxID=2867012 RepID=UPI0021A4152B|nr:DUF6151 family protein [Jannaschia sp. W003]UWQ20552.1 DUF6151 family protein [Jannaschia sp. W003]